MGALSTTLYILPWLDPSVGGWLYTLPDTIPLFETADNQNIGMVILSSRPFSKVPSPFVKCSTHNHPPFTFFSPLIPTLRGQHTPPLTTPMGSARRVFPSDPSRYSQPVWWYLPRPWSRHRQSTARTKITRVSNTVYKVSFVRLLFGHQRRMRGGCSTYIAYAFAQRLDGAADRIGHPAPRDGFVRWVKLLRIGGERGAVCYPPTALPTVPVTPEARPLAPPMMCLC